LQRYTKHYEEWKRRYLAGEEITEIAADYGCHRGTVWYALKSMGVPRRPTPQQAAHQRYAPHHTEWARLYQEGLSPTEIGAKYGADQVTVLRVLHRLGVKVKSSAEVQTKYHVRRDDVFSCIDTFEKAYWLGFLIADGSVSEGKKGYSPAVQISLQAQDAEHLRRFADFIGSNAPLYTIPKKNAVYFTARSKRLVEDLIRAGCVPQKSLTARFPSWAVPESLFGAFVLGYFDGDGSFIEVRKHGELDGWRASWSCGSIAFLEDLRRVLGHSAGIFSATLSGPRKNSRTRQLMIHRKDDLLRLYHWMYDGATVFLERKKAKWDSFVSQVS